MSLRALRSDRLFERFGSQARQAIVFAQDEARALGHDHIGTEHLLLGISQLQGGPAGGLLAAVAAEIALGQKAITDERVLLGLVANPDNSACRIVSGCGTDTQAIRHEIDSSPAPPPRLPSVDGLDDVGEHESEEGQADDAVHREERGVEPPEIPRSHERVLVRKQPADDGHAHPVPPADR